MNIEYIGVVRVRRRWPLVRDALAVLWMAICGYGIGRVK